MQWLITDLQSAMALRIITGIVAGYRFAAPHPARVNYRPEVANETNALVAILRCRTFGKMENDLAFIALVMSEAGHSSMAY